MAIDPNLEWLGHVQPVGLVVSPVVLADRGQVPAEQTRFDSDAVKALLSEGEGQPALADTWAFFNRTLGWRPAQVAGAPDGEPVPDELALKIEESDVDIAPTWAVNQPGGGWQLLVVIEAPGIRPDARGALAGWEATPHQQLERLLREKGVPAGILVTDDELRFIYAPRGETSGWLSFPLRSLGDVGGRPMLGGLKLLLSSFRLHNAAPEHRLVALLKASRDAQADVSTKLAGQVLGALHELLRGLHAADRQRIEALAAMRQDHLYDGLLTILLRLVFLLYAEDRDLIPSRMDGEGRKGARQSARRGDRRDCPAHSARASLRAKCSGDSKLPEPASRDHPDNRRSSACGRSGRRSHRTRRSRRVYSRRLGYFGRGSSGQRRDAVLRLPKTEISTPRSARPAA